MSEPDGQELHSRPGTKIGPISDSGERTEPAEPEVEST